MTLEQAKALPHGPGCTVALDAVARAFDVEVSTTPVLCTCSRAKAIADAAYPPAEPDSVAVQIANLRGSAFSANAVMIGVEVARMADEIEALKAERDTLRTVVEAARDFYKADRCFAGKCTHDRRGGTCINRIEKRLLQLTAQMQRALDGAPQYATFADFAADPDNAGFLAMTDAERLAWALKAQQGEG